MSYRDRDYGTTENEEDIPEHTPPVVADFEEVPRSVPIHTAAPRTAPAPSEGHKAQVDYWKKRMNLHGRVAGAAMAEYQTRKK